MRANFLLQCLFLSFSLFSQNEVVPFEDDDDSLYEYVDIDQEEFYLIKSIYPIEKYSIDVININGQGTQIFKPNEFSQLCMPFYYKRVNDVLAYTGWICSVDDSFRIITTLYDFDHESHILVDSLLRPGRFRNAWLTKPKNYNSFNYAFLSIADGAHTPHNMLIVAIDDSGQIELLSSAYRESDQVTGIFTISPVMDFDVLSDSTFLIRGILSSGIYLIDEGFNFLASGFGAFEHPNYNAPLTSASFWDLGFHIMDDNRVWAFGTFAEFVFNRSDPNVMIYSLYEDEITTDTIYLFENVDSYSKILGSSIKLKNNDAILCLNPDFGGPYKSEIESHIVFKRFRDYDLEWSRTYSSPYYIRVLDMAAIDSCIFIVVGSIYDYYGTNTLHGFYAIFNCEGELVSSNTNALYSVVEVLPNPASDVVSVIAGDQKEFNYSLTDVSGRCLQRGVTLNSNIDVSNLPVGTYVLRLESGSELKFLEKLMIVR